MLQDLEIQSKEEGAAEKALFQKFSYWCKTTTTMLSKDIAKEKATIAELKDKIAGLKADIATLAEEIETLGNDISDMNSAAAKAKKNSAMTRTRSTKPNRRISMAQSSQSTVLSMA